MASLTRSNFGLLAKHNSDFDVSDWTVHADITLSINAGNLRVVSTSFGPPLWHSVLYDTAVVAPRGKSMVQALFKVYATLTGTANWCGPGLHATGGALAADQDVLAVLTSMDRAIGIGEECRLIEVVDAAAPGLGAPQATSEQPRNHATSYRQVVFADGTAVVGHDFFDSLDFSETALTLASGGVGICHQADKQSAEYSDWWACSDRYLTVTNLPSGYKAKVRDSGGSILATATSVSGIALVDMLKVSFDETYDLVITDGSDVVVHTEVPADGLWGGDIYDWPDPQGEIRWAEFEVPYPEGSGFQEPLLAVLDDIPAAGGSLISRITDMVRATVTRDQGGRHSLSLTGPRSADWAEGLVRGQAIHTRLHNGEVFDWRVNSVEDGVGVGREPVTVVIADPIEIDLVDCGPIRTVTAGGTTSYAVSWVSESAEDIITRLILPQLAAYGVGWISLGSIEPTVLLTGSADMVTPAELLSILESATGTRYRLRPEGLVGYFLDMTSDLSDGAATARIRTGVNMLNVERNRTGEDVATVVIVRGAEADGVRAPIGKSAWEVDSIVADGAEFIVTLIDPEGGDGPVAMDDQFLGNGLPTTNPKSIPTHYLLYLDGTLEAITDTEAPGDFWVADDTGLSVGDMIFISPDSDGTLLTEVASPTGLNLYGRVVRYFDDEVITARENLSLNPTFEDWATQPFNMGAQVDGNQGVGLSMDIKNAVAGHVINSGDVVQIWETGFATAYYYEIDSGDTVNSGGTATITVVAGASLFAQLDDASVVIYDRSSLPDNWTDVGTSFAATDIPYTMFGRRPSAQTAGPLVGEVATPYTTDGYGIVVGGLDEDDEIYMGDQVVVGASTFKVLHDAIVDSGGQALLVLGPAQVGSPVATTVVTITRADPTAQDGQTSMLSLLPRPNRVGFSSFVPMIQGPSSAVRLISGSSRLWASAGFHFVNHSDADVTVETGALIEPPAVSLWDGAAVVGTTVADGFTLGAGEDLFLILRTFADLTADDDFAVRVRNLIDNNVHGSPLIGDPVTTLLWVELALSEEEPDEEEPAAGSTARVLHQTANRTLLRTHLWPTSIEASHRELIEFWDVVPPEPKLTLGQTVRITEPTLGVDTEMTVDRITWRLDDPENPKYILGRARQDFNERVVRALGVSSPTASTIVSGGSGTSTSRYTDSEIDAFLLWGMGVDYEDADSVEGKISVRTVVAVRNGIAQALPTLGDSVIALRADGVTREDITLTQKTE